MQGLLDFVKTPEGQGILSGLFGYAANARRGTPINNIGRGGIAGMVGYSNALDRQTQGEDEVFQRKFRQMQMDDLVRKQAKAQGEDAWREQTSKLLNPSPVSGVDAIGQGGRVGPTVDKAGAIGTVPQVDQTALQRHLLDPNSPFADEAIKRQFFPEKPKLMTVKPGDVVLNENDPTKPVFTAPEKLDPNKPFLVVDGKIVANPDYQNYEFTKAARGAARNNVTTVNNVDTTSKAFWTDFGKNQADALTAEAQAARTGLGTIRMIDDVLPRLPNAITGPGAEYRTSAVAALRSVGLDVDEKRFSNTQYIQKQLGELVLGKIKQLGANPSNADLTFITQTVPRINDDPTALRDLMMFMRQKEVERVQGYNTKIEQLRQNPGAQGIPFGLESLQVPEFTKPSATPLPTNPSASNLKRGVVYDTPRGPAEWDGFQFKKVN